MPSEGDEEPSSSSRSTPAPVEDNLEHSRLVLDNAFKHALIAVPLPAIAILVWFVNMSTYLFDRSPRLCDVTGYCIHLMNLILLLSPITAIFLIVALFPLDRYQSAFPALLRTPQGIPSVAETAEHPERNQTPPGDGEAERWTSATLRIVTITTNILGVLWAVSSLTAIANATLVLQRDIPQPGEPRKYITRVYLGYGESLLDGVLAYLLWKTAALCSRARKAWVGETAIGGHPTVDGGENVLMVEGVLHRRVVLDKTVLRLLRSLVLSVISWVVYVLFAPWSHSTHFEGRYYFLLCILSFLFAWVILFIFHSYRSAGVLPGAILRVLTSGMSLLLTVVWALYGTAFVFVSIRALFCDPHSPPPPDQTPCVYIARLAAWAGVVAGVLGLFQAGSLAGVVVGTWKATEGQIRLVDEEDGERGTVEANSLP